MNYASCLPTPIIRHPCLLALVHCSGIQIHLLLPPSSLTFAFCSGLILTVFMDITVQEVAAASLVQAAWRSHHLRGQVPLTDLLRRHRAALVIQRAWKRCEFMTRHQLQSVVLT
jgi:hypothetical protein